MAPVESFVAAMFLLIKLITIPICCDWYDGVSWELLVDDFVFANMEVHFSLNVN